MFPSRNHLSNTWMNQTTQVRLINTAPPTSPQQPDTPPSHSSTPIPPQPDTPPPHSSTPIPTSAQTQSHAQMVDSHTLIPINNSSQTMSTHPMVTRAKAGIFKPLERMNCHVTTTSPLPCSHVHALRDPHWQEAMLDEYNVVISNGTWALAPRLTNVNVGIDCDETFGLVVKPATIRTVLSLAVSRDWPIHQLDVKNVFFHVHLSETVYMHQPSGFVDPNKPDYVCHLQRSLYGLKQTPRAWFQRFSSYVIRVGFQHSKTGSSLFVFHRGSDIAYLLLYVDDIILIASSSAFLQRIIASLHSEFAMMDLGSLNYFLAIDIWLVLSQLKFAEEILEPTHMHNCNPCRTPVDTESKLGSDGDPVSDPTLYRSLTGPLQYLTFTRPDLSYAVQQLSAYTDADWASCRVTRRSTSEYCVFLGDNLLSWSAKRQVTLSRSSAKAEYRVYCDNVSTVYMSVNPVQHQRTKHIEIDIDFVRDFVAFGQVRVLHVPSRFQYSDIFTKGLPTALFIEFRCSKISRSY
nr:copia protein [Tanacetum cinerariifolium]